jgi:hypothetical protein
LRYIRVGSWGNPRWPISSPQRLCPSSPTAASVLLRRVRRTGRRGWEAAPSAQVHARPPSSPLSLLAPPSLCSPHLASSSETESRPWRTEEA